MKRLICFLSAIVIFLMIGMLTASAACYPQCQRYDIWERCYINLDNRGCEKTCMDEDDNGICDTCRDRLSQPDKEALLCPSEEDCPMQETCPDPQPACRQQENPARHHKAGHGHHGGRHGRR